MNTLQDIFGVPTKIQARSIVQGIINRAPLYAPLEGDDLATIMALLANHPRWELKSRYMQSIEVGIDGMFANSRCFYLRNGDSLCDISWHKALDNTPKERVASA